MKFVRGDVILHIAPGNGLAPHRQQAITWTKDYPVYQRTYAAIGLYELLFHMQS